MTWHPTKPGKLGNVMFSENDIMRFCRRFERLGDDECWLWTYHVGHAGHGRMWAGGRNTLASHIALHIDGRPRRNSDCALHSCDNPRCVNPRHLRWGTQIENVADRVERKRGGSARGEANGSAKLSEHDVLKIRSDARSSRKIAAEYGVSQVMVCKIKSGKAWGHVKLDTGFGREAFVPSMLAPKEEKAREVPFRERG